jgi:hypothetical protein
LAIAANGGPGWETVAGFAADWLDEVAARPL